MSKKILVADDSVVIQKSIGITFAQEDFDVTFVGNGEEAFQRAKEIKPDLILADTSMPKLSGTELCKKFRQENDLRRTPVILLSNNKETFTPDQLKTFGANDFIQKPFESSQLLEKIRPLLSQAQPKVTDFSTFSEPVAEPTFTRKDPFADADTMASFQSSPKMLEPEQSSPELDPSIFDIQRAPPLETKANLDVLNMDLDSDDDEPTDFAAVEQEEEPVPQTKIVPKTAKKDLPDAPAMPASASISTPINLSDAQIEQIVSKVFQSVIERIAWEVVPEIAERIIKEEIQKITKDG